MSDSSLLTELSGAFRHEIPFVVIFIRGTVIYLCLVVLLRIFKKGSSNMATTDILLMVLLADAAQNGMAGDYTTITDGIILLFTLVFWDFLLDFLSFKYPGVRRLIRPPQRILIQEGKLLKENLRREFMTEDEIMNKLRENGIEDIKDVKAAFLEADGQVSIIPKKK